MHKREKDFVVRPLKQAAAMTRAIFLRAFLSRTFLIGALSTGAILGSTIGSVVAHAQNAAEMSLPPLTKDPGLRSGDFVLHPSVSVMGHYDTNIFNGNDIEKGNVPKGATSIRIIPRLALANDVQSDIAFHFAAAGDGRFYLSENENIKICVTLAVTQRSTSRLVSANR